MFQVSGVNTVMNMCKIQIPVLPCFTVSAWEKLVK